MQTFAAIVFFYFFGLASLALTVWCVVVGWRFLRDAKKRRKV